MTNRNTHTLWDHIPLNMQQKLETNNEPKPDDDIFWGKIEEEFYDPNHPKMNCPLEEIIDNYIYPNNKDKKKFNMNLKK